VADDEMKRQQRQRLDHEKKNIRKRKIIARESWTEGVEKKLWQRNK
jgi:hypothetical protein